MQYHSVKETPYSLFHRLLSEYYRDGEDADTPQSEIDDFVLHLFGLCQSGAVNGCIAWEKEPIGFVLWCLDQPGSPFSQKPGYGTILEIGMVQSWRGKQIGRELVSYAEAQMKTDRFYVCAYGPAQIFWSRCGYTLSGETAENGLPIMTKG